MSEVGMEISFPLDDDGFLRRDCPLCRGQFKVLVPEEQLKTLAQRGLEPYLLEEGLMEAEPDQEEDEETLTCPYCGQDSDADSWWTEQQLNYLHAHLHNILADMVNRHLVQPLKRRATRNVGGLISIRVDAQEMEHVEPWMPPEENDMTLFELPCCGQRIKITDEWMETVYCPFCHFPHRRASE